MKPAIRRGFRLQWEPAQKTHVLLYPEGMVKLNQSAGEILKRCDGEHTVQEIVDQLELAFSMVGLSAEVNSFISTAVSRKWLELRE
jgi:pyrroloquinoline quinone biosynthesis protein D